MTQQQLKLMILDLAIAIAQVKEVECGNSGLNWLDEFKNTYPDLLKEVE